MVYCPYCGKENYDESKFCLNCGKSLNEDKKVKNTTSSKKEDNYLDKEEIKKRILYFGIFLIFWGLFIALISENMLWSVVNIGLGGILIYKREPSSILLIGIVVLILASLQIATSNSIGFFNILVGLILLYQYWKYDKAFSGSSSKINPGVTIIASILTIVAVGLYLTGGFSGYSSTNDYLEPISASELQDYNKSCQNLNLKVMIKNPDALVGQKYRVQGQISWIVENEDGTTDLAIITPESEYYHDDYIYVTHGGKTKFVEDQNVTVYGEASGSYTYTSTEDEKITLPWIKAIYMD